MYACIAPCGCTEEKKDTKEGGEKEKEKREREKSRHWFTPSRLKSKGLHEATHILTKDNALSSRNLFYHHGRTVDSVNCDNIYIVEC